MFNYFSYVVRVAKVCTPEALLNRLRRDARYEAVFAVASLAVGLFFVWLTRNNFLMGAFSVCILVFTMLMVGIFVGMCLSDLNMIDRFREVLK